MKTYYDRGTVRQEFSQGDQVLAVALLLTSPFQARFVGPYTVSKRVSVMNYTWTWSRNKSFYSRSKDGFPALPRQPIKAI